MTEKVPLKRITHKAGESEGMLEQLMQKYPGLQISEELADQVLSGEIGKAEIRRRITSGLGKGKSHCSGMFPKKEGQRKGY
ncbi:hypothetical protein KKD37_03740 [Patescibacteria group bacterium]|nr:hypothetical protein [Patescibacteria group bacterium]